MCIYANKYASIHTTLIRRTITHILIQFILSTDNKILIRDAIKYLLSFQ